ncbi:MAG: sortase [Lachnospiraceae bacterium]|nr:sortase [Lachnospiraceae bacterium]
MVSLLLDWYNFWDEKCAGDEAGKALEKIASLCPAPSDGKREQTFNPQMDMPVVEADGYLYIGTLEIPALGLKLPVMSSWSYPKMKIAPCRYTGSAYLDNLILAAHNYSTHFGRLGELTKGDAVIFTDTVGNQFFYQVDEITRLEGTAVEEMEAGEWDLTLFTCTLDSRSRITVRCVRTQEDEEESMQPELIP